MTTTYRAESLDLGEPLGRIVDVCGRAVHVLEMGNGPTVWLENGWLGLTLGWQPFQSMLAQHCRVCAYDRAGIGWSDPADSERSAQREADEFAALLDALGEGEPVIILAWSGGGPVAQIFAADHPERVAGLILMDGIPPDYDLWATQAYPHRYPRERFERMEQVRGFAEKAAVGALRKGDIAEWITTESLEQFGERYLKLLLNSPNYWWTYYWQNQYLIASGAQVRAKGLLGDLPLTVIVATEAPRDDDAYHRSLAQNWQALQYPQARLSTVGQILPIAAGHAVFRDQPGKVVNAVLDMIAVAQGAPPEAARLAGAIV